LKGQQILQGARAGNEALELERTYWVATGIAVFTTQLQRRITSFTGASHIST
jgi:hypothetical protein